MRDCEVMKPNLRRFLVTVALSAMSIAGFAGTAAADAGLSATFEYQNYCGNAPTSMKAILVNTDTETGRVHLYAWTESETPAVDHVFEVYEASTRSISLPFIPQNGHVLALNEDTGVVLMDEIMPLDCSPYAQVYASIIPGECDIRVNIGTNARNHYRANPVTLIAYNSTGLVYERTFTLGYPGTLVSDIPYVPGMDYHVFAYEHGYGKTILDQYLTTCPPAIAPAAA